LCPPLLINPTLDFVPELQNRLIHRPGLPIGHHERAPGGIETYFPARLYPPPKIPLLHALTDATGPWPVKVVKIVPEECRPFAVPVIVPAN